MLWDLITKTKVYEQIISETMRFQVLEDITFNMDIILNNKLNR